MLSYRDTQNTFLANFGTARFRLTLGYRQIETRNSSRHSNRWAGPLHARSPQGLGAAFTVAEPDDLIAARRLSSHPKRFWTIDEICREEQASTRPSPHATTAPFAQDTRHRALGAPVP